MPTLYRIVKYEFETQEELDKQMDNSLRSGLEFHLPDGKGSIAVIDAKRDPYERELDVWDNLRDWVSGCITKKQYAEVKKRAERRDRL